MENKIKKCSCCGIDLEGWIYYEYRSIKICTFCYNMLEMKGDDEE